MTRSKNFNNSCFENFTPISLELDSAVEAHLVKIFSKIEGGKIKDWRFFRPNWMKIEHVLFSSNTQQLLETCQKLAFTRPIIVRKSGF